LRRISAHEEQLGALRFQGEAGGANALRNPHEQFYRLSLKSWLVETSTGGKNWEEMDHKEDNKQLNGSQLTGIFGFADGGACRFIWLGNIENNHYG
jgi:hypothetical protein